MTHASLDGFLRFVLIFVLIYFVLRVLFRFFGPFLMRWIMKVIGKKIEKKFREQSGFYTTGDHEKEKTGKTSIHKNPPEQKTKNASTDKDTGEYIDYEEID